MVILSEPLSVTIEGKSLSGRLKCGCCKGGMIIIGSDRSGPRIQCSVHKESGACNNGARYYIQKIENIVMGALRLQLAKPDLIKEYVKAYRAERNRAESHARKQRSNLEREHTKAKAEVQKLVTAIAKGIISDDEAVNLLGPLRAEIARIEAELATAETHTNVIELHPQAVQRFREISRTWPKFSPTGTQPPTWPLSVVSAHW